MEVKINLAERFPLQDTLAKTIELGDYTTVIPANEVLSMKRAQKVSCRV